MCDAGTVEASMIHYFCIWGRQNDGCLNVYVSHVLSAGVGVREKSIENLCVLPKLGERGMKRLPTGRMPLSTIDIYESLGSLDINHKDTVMGDDSKIHLENFHTLSYLKVMQDCVGGREVIAQIANGSAL